MLQEVESVRQHAEEGHRRWFTDRQFDLIVWYEGSDVVGFQLCYDKESTERALTWYSSGSYSHTRVDDGDEPMSARRSPVLVRDGVFDTGRVLSLFREAAAEIDPKIADLVIERLEAYPE